MANLAHLDIVEPMPLAVSLFLLSVSLSFTIFVAVDTYRQLKRKPKWNKSALEDNACPEEDASRVSLAEMEEDQHLENANTNPVFMSWNHVSCAFPSSRKESSADSENTVHALKESHGQLNIGEITGIMGPSGSGKSTLMQILSGRKTVGKITGEVSLFGNTITDMNSVNALLHDVAAIVPQEVSFFPMQTPEEAVLFVACLKQGHAGTNKEKAHKLLRSVGLGEPSLYTRSIGGELPGGLTVPGLSGGERRRLALACALAMQPRLLLLDEITSGIDSESAQEIMQLLKELCNKQNVTAAVVIHQPSGYVFEIMDRLILLADGQCVFSDGRGKLAEFYDRSFSSKMPASVHDIPLDILKRLKRGQFACVPDQPTSLSCSCDWTPLRNSVPPHWMLRIVFRRNLENHYVRNLTNLAGRVAIYVGLYFVAGGLFWKVGDDANVPVAGAFFYLLIGSYLLPFAVIPVFMHEKNIVLSERNLGLYPPWIYCVSQTLLEGWVLVLCAIIQAAISIPMCSLWSTEQPRWAYFLSTLSIFIGGGLLGSELILLSSILMPSQDLAFLLGSGMVTVSLGLSGGFVPFDSIAPALRWLQWLSPCKYSLQALVINYYTGAGDDHLEHTHLDKPSTVSGNIGALYAMYTVIALLTMLVLNGLQEKR